VRDIAQVRYSRLFLSVFAALALAGFAHAEPDWLTDFDQAQQKAKSDNKLLLVDFTGSDWCGWCIKLHREVFSKPEFSEYAKKNLVLVEVDFPRAKQIDRAVLRKNMELAEKFRVEAFPTIVVLNGEGKIIGSLSYDSGIPPDSDKPLATPAAFIASVEKLRKS
jgi:thioredoxin-related protein